MQLRRFTFGLGSNRVVAKGLRSLPSLETPCSVTNLWWHFNYSIFRQQKF